MNISIYLQQPKRVMKRESKKG